MARYAHLTKIKAHHTYQEEEEEEEEGEKKRVKEICILVSYTNVSTGL